jgi:hypothetical protein
MQAIARGVQSQQHPSYPASRILCRQQQCGRSDASCRCLQGCALQGFTGYFSELARSLIMEVYTESLTQKATCMCKGYEASRGGHASTVTCFPCDLSDGTRIVLCTDQLHSVESVKKHVAGNRADHLQCSVCSGFSLRATNGGAHHSYSAAVVCSAPKLMSASA